MQEQRKAIGHTRWVIAEGYIPPDDENGKSPQLISHETMCILNAGNTDAQVEVTLYFSDKAPVGPYRFTVAAQRTRHVRFNDLSDPSPVPRDTDYASVIESDVPIVVQHTRLDSRQDALALMTTVAFAT